MVLLLSSGSSGGQVVETVVRKCIMCWTNKGPQVRFLVALICEDYLQVEMAYKLIIAARGKCVVSGGCRCCNST